MKTSLTFVSCSFALALLAAAPDAARAAVTDCSSGSAPTMYENSPCVIDTEAVCTHHANIDQLLCLGDTVADGAAVGVEMTAVYDYGNHDAFTVWGRTTTGQNYFCCEFDDASDRLYTVRLDGTDYADTLKLNYSSGAYNLTFSSAMDDLGGRLYGWTGDDTLEGSYAETLPYNESLYGGYGDDAMNGRQGDDVLFGGPDDDVLHGGTGHDILLGEGGEDTVDGGAGDDRMTGNDGTDVLTGEAGDDVLCDDQDGDLLDGGIGVNKLWYGDASATPPDPASDCGPCPASGWHKFGKAFTWSLPSYCSSACTIGITARPAECPTW